MKKSLIGLFLLTYIFAGNPDATWQPLPNKDTAASSPVIEFLQHDQQVVEYEIDVPGFYLEKGFDKAGRFDRVDFQTESVTGIPGLPEVPYFAQLLAIPGDAAVVAEIVELAEPVIYENIHLPPARASWQEGHKEPEYIYSSDAAKLNQAYPAYHTRVEDPVVFRDLRLARVSTYPIRYDYGKKQMVVYPKLKVRVTFTAGASKNHKETRPRPIAPSFIPIYRSSVANFDQFAAQNQLDLESGRDLMLCIMPDEFKASFTPYAEWKRRSGTDIAITTFSEIGASGNTPDIVKDHISDAYHNWEIPPSYVLIIGDDGIFPAKYISYDYTFAYEDFFVELEGDDYFPEMFIGRMTNPIGADGLEDYPMRVMLNKFRMYEEDPYVDETHWYTQGVVCSNNAYQSQVETKRFTRDVMLEDGLFTAVDDYLSDEGAACTADLSDVIGSLENGRSFLNYRGEGWTSGWWASCYSFGADDVSGLNNGRMFPFITSIGCGVANFDEGSGNSFGEEWIELGSLTYPRGAVAFIGPVSNTHTTYNNRIDKGIYVGMFREKMDTPGQAMMRGKLYMYNVFGDVPGSINWTEYHYRVFSVLGDPSVNIWKSVPEPVSVEFPADVALRFDQLNFNIKRTSDQQPIANAQVVITGASLFKTVRTDETGYASIDLTSETVEDLSIYVRGQGVYPVQTTVPIVSRAVNITVIDGSLKEDANGNTDGKINPGETLTINSSVKNWGFESASNVSFTVTSSSPDVTIINGGPFSLGSLVAEETKTNDQVQFSLASTAAIGQKVFLNYSLTSDQDNGQFQRVFEVKGSDISTRQYFVDDAGSSLENFRLDPGETADILIQIANTGEDVAPSVRAVLSSTDPYITIVDSIGEYGTITYPDTVVNSDNTYRITVAPECPAEHQAEFTLKMSTNDYFYTYTKTQTLKMSIGILTEFDPLGPDNYGYYAYTPEDARFEQAPAFAWHEIKDIGTNLYQSGHGSDYNYIVDLPFGFNYYGVTHEKLTISTDGWIAFGEYSTPEWSNTALPRSDGIANFVAVFWDDLFTPGDSDPDIGLYTYYDQARRTFTIQWNDVGHYSDPTNRETFQVILSRSHLDDLPTDDDYILMQYKEMTEEGSCTIGIENGTESDALQYIYNGSLPVPASDPGPEMAILFTTATPSIVTSIVDAEVVPQKYALKPNYPNPFNPTTTIAYQLPEASQVRLMIYDIRGALVKTVDQGFKPLGTHRVVWDGTNSAGQAVSSGTYFYQLEAGKHLETRKMILLK
jgi:hypothetical protein